MNLKSLAKDTAIYGLSSIVGRFLNYLLVPVYTYKIAAASGGYGIVTNLYAYTALLPPRHPYLRYGDHFFPFFKQGRRRPAQGVWYVAQDGRRRGPSVRRGRACNGPSDCRGDGICRPSRVYRVHGHYRRAGRFSGHHVLQTADRPPPAEVHGAQVCVHHTEYPPDTLHLPGDAEDVRCVSRPGSRLSAFQRRSGFHILRQPCLHGAGDQNACWPIPGRCCC